MKSFSQVSSNPTFHSLNMQDGAASGCLPNISLAKQKDNFHVKDKHTNKNGFDLKSQLKVKLSIKLTQQQHDEECSVVPQSLENSCLLLLQRLV